MILANTEISHIAENQLNVATFHGKDRANEPSAFYHSDLVLTTYSTLVKDFQTMQVLYRLDWFRIILDEGRK
jgi:SNF2 family DNA or RNA helicase